MTEKFKILKIISFAAIIMIIITVLSAAIDPSSTNAGMEKKDKVMIELNNEQENSIDVFVLGDSEAYRSITPLEMYRDYGFTTYVSASPAQKTYQTYEMLSSILENQTPKVCILDTNHFFTEYTHIASVLPKIEAAFPIFKYHNIWKSVFAPSYEYDETVTNSYKGYRYTSDVKPVKIKQNTEPTDKSRTLSRDNLDYIDSIIELCDKNDIQLIFISSPSVKNWNYEKHNAIKKLAENKDIPFIDFNLEESVNIDWTTDTFDRGDHLNYSGAHKITAYIGSYLNENYDLPDHRKDEYYSSWEKALKSYSKSVLKSDI